MAYTAYEPMTLEQILARVKKVDTDGSGIALVQRAYDYAADAHKDQKRKSGEPYIVHPLYVASIITELMIDPPTIAAALLHDVVEDTGATVQQMQDMFGEEVARLVDGVTKLTKLNFADREEQQAESLRKMILAMSKDIRVVLIKLADRLHNMRTLKFKEPERQVAIARETLDIYAPLAHRLGVYGIKQELEDLSLRYIDPEGYQDVAQKVGMKRAEREENIKLVISELSHKLDEQGLHYDIDGRPKHLYSIYRKMVIQNKPFDQIFDLIAIRVIVDTIPECYTVLGIAHTLWNQVPGRFKDYISVPKANMYQSLHTTVVGGRRIPFPFEIQIRTWEMHRVAEYGIAAHWRYKEGGKKDDNLDNKLYWLRQILDWQSETRDSHEFIDSLKTDLFSEEVFLFTPKGDIVSMQRGSTPLDFAYRIHSQVGNSCVGARINGKMVPLDTQLQTGDRVEVITSSTSKGPSMDWLKGSRGQAPGRQAGGLHQAGVLRTPAAEVYVPGPGRSVRRHRLRRRGGGVRPQPHDRRKTEKGSRRRAQAGSRATGDAAAQRRRGQAQPRHLRPRRSRDAGALRPLLQPRPRRRHRGLHHPRPGRDRAQGGLRERPALRARTRRARLLGCRGTGKLQRQRDHHLLRPQFPLRRNHQFHPGSGHPPDRPEREAEQKQNLHHHDHHAGQIPRTAGRRAGQDSAPQRRDRGVPERELMPRVARIEFRVQSTEYR